MYVWAHVCHDTRMEVRGQLWESVSSHHQVPRIDCRFVRLGITPSPAELFGQPRSKMAVLVARVSTGFRGRELMHNMWIFQHIGKVDAILDLLIGIFKVSFIIIYFVRFCEWTYSCHDTWMFVM